MTVTHIFQCHRIEYINLKMNRNWDEKQKQKQDATTVTGSVSGFKFKPYISNNATSLDYGSTIEQSPNIYISRSDRILSGNIRCMINSPLLIAEGIPKYAYVSQRYEYLDSFGIWHILLDKQTRYNSSGKLIIAYAIIYGKIDEARDQFVHQQRRQLLYPTTKQFVNTLKALNMPQLIVKYQLSYLLEEENQPASPSKLVQ